MPEPDRIQDFLRRLTPLSRNNLLTELERLEACGSALPGCATVVEKLRTEFRKDGQPHRLDNPVRYFFAPLESLLVDGAPEHANSGRILRGSLSPIWEWISRNLLPTMARDYVNEMNRLIATDNQREAGRVVSTFQTKVVKSLEGTLNVPDSAALAAKIGKFDDAQVTKISALLDGVRKTNAETVPFALALVATRLKTPWQLIRLATKAAPSKNVADVAATPYAVVVSMVLDRLEDGRSALRIALRNNRVLVAKEILTEIYDAEYALQVRIDRFDESDWGKRLQNLMSAISALVEAEVSRFPDNVDHVLASRSLRSHQSLAGRLTHLAWKGRDAVSDGAAYWKKLINA